MKRELRSCNVKRAILVEKHASRVTVLAALPSASQRSSGGDPIIGQRIAKGLAFGDRCGVLRPGKMTALVGGVVAPALVRRSSSSGDL